MSRVCPSKSLNACLRQSCSLAVRLCFFRFLRPACPVHLVRSGAGGSHLRNHGEFEKGGVWVGGSIVCFSCGVFAGARIFPGAPANGITRTRHHGLEKSPSNKTSLRQRFLDDPSLRYLSYFYVGCWLGSLVLVIDHLSLFFSFLRLLLLPPITVLPPLRRPLLIFLRLYYSCFARCLSNRASCSAITV